ncbi:metal-sulfur cluster assembly factor [Sinomonas halotolerans]|uniref:Metal-sulfur cluster assembly factor n=1 Tax=Sinomonas halotolerans TaxID=1644133 RepID=A0ABU9X150_9MICC
MTEIQPAQTSLEDVEESLKDVIDPELGVNVVDLGLVYGLEYGEDGALLINMTLTTAACPLTDVLEEQVGKALEGVVDEWRLNWVWMPPWGPERITEDGRDQMRALGFNI